MTRIPSSRAMAAALVFFGCEASRFDFRPHSEARIPRNRAVPMFPAPMTPIFRTGIFSFLFRDRAGVRATKEHLSLPADEPEHAVAGRKEEPLGRLRNEVLDLGLVDAASPDDFS